jgi:hypothetical protein
MVVVRAMAVMVVVAAAVAGYATHIFNFWKPYLRFY